uniref:Uncharacterized protein n=1 Tax=Romanomermis culicivorax TaxID=13658 RepID=A0A915IIA3_ROMCU
MHNDSEKLGIDFDQHILDNQKLLEILRNKITIRGGAFHEPPVGGGCCFGGVPQPLGPPPTSDLGIFCCCIIELAALLDGLPCGPSMENLQKILHLITTNTSSKSKTSMSISQQRKDNHRPPEKNFWIRHWVVARVSGAQSNKVKKTSRRT